MSFQLKRMAVKSAEVSEKQDTAQAVVDSYLDDLNSRIRSILDEFRFHSQRFLTVKSPFEDIICVTVRDLEIESKLCTWTLLYGNNIPLFSIDIIIFDTGFVRCFRIILGPKTELNIDFASLEAESFEDLVNLVDQIGIHYYVIED